MAVMAVWFSCAKKTGKDLKCYTNVVTVVANKI